MSQLSDVIWGELIYRMRLTDPFNYPQVLLPNRKPRWMSLSLDMPRHMPPVQFQWVMAVVLHFLKMTAKWKRAFLLEGHIPHIAPTPPPKSASSRV